MILAIDPGTTESGVIEFDAGRVHASYIMPNEQVIQRIRWWTCPDLAIEMVASYGMPVGAEVFDTVRWIGRFQQAFHLPDQVRLIFRKDVKMHLCGSPRAKDGNIRQALIDKLGPQGTKKNPGPTYGVKSHAWAALAVAVTALEVPRA
ncbi:hypothetical protein ACQKIE_16145 [Luteibacter sp. NPDC031894]|uniref:hypothetical protein n=1 Tax=Luteibacter sp. NPDC031894 TaxID=3390572 RepID=UPI003D013371